MKKLSKGGRGTETLLPLNPKPKPRVRALKPYSPCTLLHTTSSLPGIRPVTTPEEVCFEGPSVSLGG